MNHLIRDVLSTKSDQVEAIAPEMPVQQAAERMHVRQVGSLLVVDAGRLVGIITERDLLGRVVAAQRDPTSTRVDEVMTRQLTVVAPEATVEDALRLITRMRCRHLPVVDRAN